MRVLLFTLLLALYAFAVDAADSTRSDVSVPDSSSTQVKPAKNIPLPRQTAYTGRGLSIGIGAGIYDPTDDCDCLGVWQGQLEYFYADWASGGIDVRFFGGDLDRDVMIMYQRYRANVRFHKAWSKLDIYAEPILGFENTSISEFRDQLERKGRFSKDSSDVPLDSALTDSLLDADSVVAKIRHREDCERMLTLDGFSIGVGAGFGLNLSRLWGITGNVLFEYNFSDVMQLSLIPGVAFNLRELWPWAKRTLLSTWISVEFGALRNFNRGVREWSNYILFGVQLGG